MFKFIIGIAIGVLLVIMIIQNTVIVEFDFLVWSFSMSRAILLLIFLGAGMFIGWLVSSLASWKRRRNKNS